MKVKTEYSIISRGTEKYSNHGYMGISTPIMDKQYILDIDHGVLESELNAHVLEFEANNYSLSNIAVSRFELISRILLERYKVKDNILILGFGNIGFTCLLALLKLGYTKISVFTRSANVDINALKEKFNVEVNFVNKISNSYETYIDTTGSSDIIKNVIEQNFSMKDILILSTPRESTYLIDPLIINRKNLTIIGGHELNGIDKKWRNNLFKKILKENTELENILNTYISITAYSKSNIRKLIDNKKALIDIIQY